MWPRTDKTPGNIMGKNTDAVTNHWKSLRSYSQIPFLLAMQYNESVALIIQYNQARICTHPFFRIIEYILSHLSYRES